MPPLWRRWYFPGRICEFIRLTHALLSVCVSRWIITCSLQFYDLPRIAAKLTIARSGAMNVITIGIRAAPRVVTFVVYDTARRAIVNIEAIKIPAAFSRPDGLKYVRSNILDILREFKVEKAGIRATEPSSQAQLIERIELEGVIQEVFASSNLISYYVGHISSISARLGINRTEFRPYVEGQRDYDVENWATMSREQREATRCAIGAEDV
jgi:hypothetical protein